MVNEIVAVVITCCDIINRSLTGIASLRMQNLFPVDQYNIHLFLERVARCIILCGKDLLKERMIPNSVLDILTTQVFEL